MSQAFTATKIERDLEEQLAPRRRVETQFKLNPGLHGGRNFFQRHDHFLAKLIQAGLRATFQYSRGLANALKPEVRRLRLEFSNLPRGLDGFQILHLSDFHVDGMDGLTEVLAEELPKLPVDLCVWTGDFRFETKGECDAVYPRMRRILRSIRSRHGVVGILGNHDCADIAVELQAMGVRMLVNDAIAVGSREDRLWVIGVDDPYTYGCHDLAGAMEGIPARDFKLLLAHTPEMFQEAESSLVHLYLCGHTHAGQIRLPIVGPAIVNADCPKDFTYGHWYYRNMQGYTTSGIGCSLLPIRYGCPPEIVLIELARR